MSVEDRQNQYIFEQAQRAASDVENTFRKYVVLPTPGLAVIAVQADPAGRKLQLYDVSVYNPGTKTVLIRGYAGPVSTANLLFHLAVPAAVTSKLDQHPVSLRLPGGTSLIVVASGHNSGVQVEALLYGYYS